MKFPFEFLFELTWDRTLEVYLDRAVLADIKCFFIDREVEHFSECSFWFNKFESAGYFSSVLDLDCLSDWLIDKDISEVYFLLG